MSNQKTSDKIIKKNQFLIRKVPIKRIAPQKVPQLYALDIHSICLPNKQKKNINWASIHCDNSKNYQQDYNDRIMYSQTYQLLYSKYASLKQQRQKQKQSLQNQIDQINYKIQKQQLEKSRLTTIRDKFYNQIENLRQELTECRNKNYNLRWEIYHQRGTYYININNYSFLQNGQGTYEDYLLLEEQMGNVPRGLNQIELALLPKVQFNPTQKIQQTISINNSINPHTKLYQNLQKTQDSPQKSSNLNELSLNTHEKNPQNSINPENQDPLYTKQICCICYDEINKGQYVTILKCKHIHHCDCIKDWLAKQKNCPICKKQVILDEFHMKKDNITKPIEE